MELKHKLFIIILGAAAGLYWYSESKATSGKKIIAITQIVDHKSLNLARQGIIDTLSKAGYDDKQNIELNYYTANGSLAMARQIAVNINHLKPNVIIPISTTSAQIAIATNSNNSPIVFSSVADPIDAKLVSNLFKPGGNITGSMDMPPIEDLMVIIRQIIPELNKIGVIYSAGETNSVKAVQKMQIMGLPLVERAVSTSAEVLSAVTALIGKVDIIILPSDNTVWPALEALTRLAAEQHIPVFANDPDATSKGVVIALGYDQYQVGVNAGNKAIQVLNGTAVGDIPVTSPEIKSLYINLEMANKLGLHIPAIMLQQATKIIKEEKII